MAARRRLAAYKISSSFVARRKPASGHQLLATLKQTPCSKCAPLVQLFADLCRGGGLDVNPVGLKSVAIHIYLHIYTRIRTLEQTPCSKMCSVGTALRTFAVIFVKLKWSHFLPGSPELLQKPRSAHRNPQQTLGLPSWFFWSSFSGDNVPGTGCSELVNPLWDPNNGQRNFGDNFNRKFLG